MKAKYTIQQFGRLSTKRVEIIGREGKKIICKYGKSKYFTTSNKYITLLQDNK